MWRTRRIPVAFALTLAMVATVVVVTSTAAVAADLSVSQALAAQDGRRRRSPDTWSGNRSPKPLSYGPGLAATHGACHGRTTRWRCLAAGRSRTTEVSVMSCVAETSTSAVGGATNLSRAWPTSQ
jgi:hypothetical protein